MKIRDTYRSRIQRVELANQAPAYIISDTLYLVESMEESYVTTGFDTAHHTLTAKLVNPNTDCKFDLDVDYNANEYSLRPVGGCNHG